MTMAYPDPLDKSVPIAVADDRVPVFDFVTERWPDRRAAMRYVREQHAWDLARADGRREVHVSLR